jgi:capsular exopolysaccharide synthesis family protein
MSASFPSTRPSRESVADERIDVRRYLDAIRRSRWLIAAIVVLLTGAVLVISLVLPNTYTADARIVFEDPVAPLGGEDAESTRRRLATAEKLLTTPEVLSAAARRVRGETRASIEDKVESAVDQEANIIDVAVSDRDPERAAAIANAVATSFLNKRADLERDQIRSARRALERELRQLTATPEAGVPPAPNANVQVQAIREQLSQLAAREPTAGADFQLAERATAPSAPTSPRPVRNAILALFGSLFLGVLVALGRDQLTPRVAGTRELGRLLDLPVLAGIPYIRGRLGRRRQALSGVELEAYQTLRASLEVQLDTDRKHVILVTGAVHAEGKTTATARLGRALAQAGHRTLVVSADLRVPRLHEMFGLPLGVGLADILAVLDWDTATFDDELLQRATHVVVSGLRGRQQRGELHVITSGTRAKEPGRLISGPAMAAFVQHLRTLDYDYVLLDGPPLLGMADSQVLARQVDELLLVSRLDRVSLEHVSELREVIDRLDVRPLGIVVIGARGELSPYYLARRPPLLREAEPSQ